MLYIARYLIHQNGCKIRNKECQQQCREVLKDFVWCRLSLPPLLLLVDVDAGHACSPFNPDSHQLDPTLDGIGWPTPHHSGSTLNPFKSVEQKLFGGKFLGPAALYFAIPASRSWILGLMNGCREGNGRSASRGSVSASGREVLAKMLGACRPPCCAPPTLDLPAYYVSLFCQVESLIMPQ